MTLKVVRQATKKALLSLVAIGGMAASHQALALSIEIDLDVLTPGIQSTHSVAPGSTLDVAFLLVPSSDGSDAGTAWDTYSTSLRNDNPLVSLASVSHGALTDPFFLTVFLGGGVAVDPGTLLPAFPGAPAAVSASETAGAFIAGPMPWSVGPPTPPGIPAGSPVPLFTAEYFIDPSAGGTTALFDLGDPGDTALFLGGGALAGIVLEGATLEIESVPVPASIALMMAGLAGLGLRRRRTA